MANTFDRLKIALADHYALQEELGAGGMATVYLAEDLKHHRKVAVKVLRPELAAVLGAERFLKEIEVTANLQHPHILPLFDSGEADSFLYYVMPFIAGETVRDKLNRETQLGIDEAVSITTDVAGALDYAHRQNVIHRDIKPENILLHDGRPMVADFGIALAVSAAAGSRMTETGLSLGTPHYMSPEQATAEKDLTNRSDIYSLGCVLYEMLTGDPPHTGSSAQAIIMKIVTDEARPVTELRKSVPPHVAAATAKALEKLAADRFASAAKFAEALTNPAFTVSTTQPIAARQARGLWNWLSTAASGAAVVAIGIALFALLRAGPAPPVSRHRITLWEMEPGAGSLPYIAAIAPDGSAIVFADSTGGRWQLWLKERDRIEATPLAGTVDATGPVFSPDGAWIGFVQDAELKKIPRGGGAAITLADSVERPPGAWLDDGTIVFAKGRFDLVRISDAGGESETVATTADTDDRAFTLITPLPGARGVLFSACAVSCEVWVLDLRTREVRALVEDGYRAWYVPTGHLVYVRQDGGVLAAQFDLGTLTLRSAPVPLLDGIRTPDLLVSPSGTLLYVSGSAGQDEFEVVWVDRSGAVTPVDPDWGTVRMPDDGGLALSPDGTRLALSLVGEEADIWVKQLPAGPLSRLTFEHLVNYRPAWSPDGRSVSYLSEGPDRIGRAGLDVWTKRVDGSGPAERLLDWKEDIWAHAWSRDGRWLVFRDLASSPENRDIYALRVGVDSVPVPLLNTRFNETAPTISPDGRWLAYVSNESGRAEVYVRPFPNVRDGSWQVSLDGGGEPKWAHSGRELFYREESRMMVAQVATGATFDVSARSVLFDAGPLIWRSDRFAYGYPLYDVSPDDQRFLMARRSGPSNEAAVELIVVENFFEELKAKVGN